MWRRNGELGAVRWDECIDERRPDAISEIPGVGVTQVSLMADMDDARLVEQICGGCEESLLHLVADRCGAYLRFAARSFRYDGDLEHDLCVHLFGSGDWSRLRTWQGGSLNSWIQSVARNICLNAHRTRMKYLGRFEHLSPGGESSDVATPSAEHQMIEHEDRRMKILKAVDQLNARDKEVVMLHCLGDLTIEGLAERLGLTVPATRVIKTRALARLRDMLSEEQDHD